MARIRPARNDGQGKDDGGDTPPPTTPARARKAGKSEKSKAPQSPRPAPPQSRRTKSGSVTKDVQDTRKSSRFLSDVVAELRKVQWPTRSQLMQSTAVVILVVAIVTIYLDVIDTIISSVVRHIF
jgi:preprotein translocase subunit SecE